jgi:hypothetical protein
MMNKLNICGECKKCKRLKHRNLEITAFWCLYHQMIVNNREESCYLGWLLDWRTR